MPTDREFAMTFPTVEDIRAEASKLAFGNPLIQNNLCGLVAEVIVGRALGSARKWCAGDWLGWDFEHEDGTRLEVKQSAAKQTWSPPKKPKPPIFDIRFRSGYYIGAEWCAQVGRPADIYVFAYHFATDEAANHCDLRQWKFYVVRAASLPPGKTIGLKAVSSLSRFALWPALDELVESTRQKSDRVIQRD